MGKSALERNRRTPCMEAIGRERLLNVRCPTNWEHKPPPIETLRYVLEAAMPAVGKSGMAKINSHVTKR
ncbi:MAG: hypothetical protein EOP69_00620 [Spirochaetia bacterium]|nr:MAG: hypothetical protein EOP69_00620 [Spirochaetia bacterium]